LIAGDEKGNIYIVGNITQAVYEDSNRAQFNLRTNESIALLHDHDLDLFSELATLQEEACSFGGSWRWHGKQLALDPIHSSELANRFDYAPKPAA
jgi:hypothetical protein